MTFVKLALCVACSAGLGLVIYSGKCRTWLNARLITKRDCTPPTTSALFATIPADVLISATGRVELTRMPFAEFNPHGISTERAQARLEQARATNARNQARSPRAPSPGARREAGARTRVGSYWAAGARLRHIYSGVVIVSKGEHCLYRPKVNFANLCKPGTFG